MHTKIILIGSAGSGLFALAAARMAAQQPKLEVIVLNAEDTLEDLLHEHGVERPVVVDMPLAIEITPVDRTASQMAHGYRIPKNPNYHPHIPQKKFLRHRRY